MTTVNIWHATSQMMHIAKITPLTARKGRLVLTLLMMLLTTATAWADITISSEDDWNTFAWNVNKGTTYSGETVTLANDIIVTTMAGDDIHDFKGTFYGGGHKLTFNATATADFCAPFFSINSATIKCLKVAGTISTGFKYAAGIAVYSYGNCTIQNCQSSITINSAINGDGTHAGFVALEESGSLTFTNCLFDGSITGDSTTNCGGFVGWRGSGAMTFNNCLMAGTMTISQTDDSALFNRNGESTLTNCYYDGSKSYGPIQTQDATSTTATGSDLQTLLGSGWEVIANDVVVPIMDAKNLAIATISGSRYYLYTGSNIDINYTVRANDGTALTKGTDYTETITKSGIASTVQEKGDYTLTVSGTGSYNGSQAFHFTVYDGTTVTSETTEMTTGFYAVRENVTIDSRITVSGNVVLLLCDNDTMNATKGFDVSANNSLTINAESTGNSMGVLIATANTDYRAGIGSGTGVACGTITINGGIVEATGGQNAAGIGGGPDGAGGTITINGGNVTATGGQYAAGIGGGNWSNRQNINYSGTIIVNGGNVTANGGYSGAGIGGGVSGAGGTIEINGGNVTATTDMNGQGAGIGGGAGGAGGTITISGGTVYAHGPNGTAGIGGGDFGAGGTITISGGKVTAWVNSNGAGIGGGYQGAGGTITLSYTETEDYVNASSYNGTVSIAPNKTFTDGTNTYTSATPSETLAALTYTTLTPKQFNITVSECTKGTVTAQEKAINSETVSLTATPDEGYVLQELTVTDGSDTPVAVTDGQFFMPGSDVTVSAAFAPDPAHFSVNGDSTEYIIHTATGWNVFCDALQDNANYQRFSGKTVKLGNDITATTMAGSTDHEFCGMFDGDCQTLTFNYGSAEAYANEQHIAPFSYVNTVTPESGTEVTAAIKNLHVTGQIYTSTKYAAGIIAQHGGTVNMENCRSSMVIHSNADDDGNNGGLVGTVSGTLSITGCLFDGKLLTTNGTTSCGGFVGWNAGDVSISNSLYAPAALEENETEVLTGNVDSHPSATFVRDNGSVQNSYYTRTLGTAQVTAPFIYNSLPDGIGTEGTTYSTSGITAYENGLAYDGKYYTAPPATLALTANLADGNYWTTFYCGDAGYTIDDEVNACAYTATVSDETITLHKLGKVIPQRTAVIIVGKDASIDMTKDNTSAAQYSVSNDLHGVDVATATTTVLSSYTGAATLYFLSNKNGNFGFHDFGGTTVPARKAFLALDESNPTNARNLTMTFEEETGIRSLTPAPSPKGEGSEYFFTLDGRKLSSKPTKHGVYVKNRRKIVVK